MIEQRLSLVTLGVADLARATAFYEALGWTRSLRAAEGVAFFQLDGMGLSLFPREALAEDAGQPLGMHRGFPNFSLAHNVRSRGEVDAVVGRWCAAGGTVLHPAEDKVWGGYSAYVADSEGFAWEIAWNPGFPIGDDGGIAIPA